MTSATIYLWKDVGYTEGCLEVPKIGTNLPTPDFTFEKLEISTSTLFSECKLKGAFADLLPCSYLQLIFFSNNSTQLSFDGWIDKVSIGSDSEGSPMTRIQWHVDLWRTYISKVTLGSGIVKRRTATGDLPPQSYSNRYTLARTPRTIIPETITYWVFLNLTKTEDGVTTTTTYCWPVPTIEQVIYRGKTTAGETVRFLGIEDTLKGSFDESLGLDPDAIFSGFISPVPPQKATIDGSYVSMPWDLKIFGTYNGESCGAFEYRSNLTAYEKQDFTTLAQTTDTVAYVVTDMDRAPVGALPWGISVSGGSYRLVNTTSSMYLKIWFTGSLSGATFDEGSQPANGLDFTIPLKTLAVSTNAKSSYIYSGQQELDREQMAIQRQQALYSGLGSMANQAIQGAMGGAMIGVATGGSAAMGAGIGGASSGVGGGISAITDYFVTGWANDKMMDATIRQKANQTSYLTLPSDGTDWIVFGHVPQLVPLQWDDYSITQRTQDMALYGAHVEEPRTSCQSLLTAGGPLQIANCTVTGSVPPEAKRYIKDRLASGVRIV